MSLTQLLAADGVVQVELAEVVVVVLAGPGAREPLVGLLVLGPGPLPLLPHQHDAGPGHAGQGPVLPQTAGLEDGASRLSTSSLGAVSIITHSNTSDDVLHVMTSSTVGGVCVAVKHRII